MGLTSYKLGDFLQLHTEKCGESRCKDVKGINIHKEFIPSKNVGADTTKYVLVPPFHFSANFMHIGRDERIPIAFNDTGENLVVSSAYVTFKITDNTVCLNEYFKMIATSPEFDRYTWFCTDSSVRGNLTWKEFCDIELDLPSREIQQKYVDIYLAMKQNQQCYERGLEDLKLTCDGYIEELKHSELRPIGEYLEVINEKNKELSLCEEEVRGISVDKQFISTKADLNGVSLQNYRVVHPTCFSYVPDTSRRGDKISLAYNNTDGDFLVSSVYLVYKVVKTDKMIPEYLYLFYNQPEFDRYARFHSWGSAREVFSWDEMCAVKIPVPELHIQQDIVNIYKAYEIRREISEKLKEQMKNICPILVKGAVEEGAR